MTGAQRLFQIHAVAWVVVNAFLFMIWLIGDRGTPWFLFAAGGWGIGLALHATVQYGLGLGLGSDDDPEELDA